MRWSWSLSTSANSRRGSKSAANAVPFTLKATCVIPRPCSRRGLPPRPAIAAPAAGIRLALPSARRGTRPPRPRSGPRRLPVPGHGFSDQTPLGLARADRRGPAREQRHRGVDAAPAVVEREDGGHAGECEVAEACCVLAEAHPGSLGRRRDLHRRDHLVIIAGGDELRPEECFPVERRITSRRPQVHARVEGRQNHRQLGGRIGVRHRPADRPAAARLRVPDIARVRYAAAAIGPPRAANALPSSAGRRPEQQPPLASVYVRKRRNARDVDKPLGRASRKFSRGTRLCPPASTRASSPYRRNSSTASSSDVGQS